MLQQIENCCILFYFPKRIKLAVMIGFSITKLFTEGFQFKSNFLLTVSSSLIIVQASAVVQLFPYDIFLQPFLSELQKMKVNNNNELDTEIWHLFKFYVFNIFSILASAK